MANSGRITSLKLALGSVAGLACTAHPVSATGFKDFTVVLDETAAICFVREKDALLEAAWAAPDGRYLVDLRSCAEEVERAVTAERTRIGAIDPSERSRMPVNPQRQRRPAGWMQFALRPHEVECVIARLEAAPLQPTMKIFLLSDCPR